MNNKPITSERFEFVGELLNGEELLERLAAAQDVAANLNAKIEVRDDKIEALRKELKKRSDTIDNMQSQMVDIAGDLARAGGQVHKDKDEILLIAISRLLSWGIRGAPVRDMDDIPF